MSYLVSIIVPVYNVEKYIRECVNSIVNQTYESLEIILVNDGSTDNSGLICDEYAKQDNRIMVIHKANGGLSDARNAGIDSSSGDYILFVDSDDMIVPNMVETLMKYVDSSEGPLDMVYFGFSKLYRNTTINECPKEAKFSKIEALRKWVDDIDIHSYACSAIYKKTLWNDIRFPVGKLYEDIRTTYKLILLSEVVVSTDQALYIYRQRQGSITKDILGEKKLQSLEATKDLEKVDAIANDPQCIINLNNRILRVKGYLLIDLLKTNLAKHEELKREYYNEYRKNFTHIIFNKSFPKSLKLVSILSVFGLSVLEYTFRDGFMKRYYQNNYKLFD